jgi:hypothetical protein
MDTYYNISYVNLDENDLYKIYDKINSFSNNIKDNSYSSFENNSSENSYLSMDKFIVDSPIISSKNNCIKKANFYIKKNINSKLYNSDCLICFDHIIIINSNKFRCNHILCKSCYIKWDYECIKKNKNIYCPLCMK